jgi:two-component system, sensor histidine kinase and response regulator
MASVPLTPELLELIAGEVVEIVRPKADSLGLEVWLDPADGAAVVRSDPGTVRQILLNLIGNAVQYTPAGTVGVEIDRSAAEWIQVHVRATGPGIAAEDQERIFEPFTQLDGSLTRAGGGTGLGLAICRRLADLLDGEIEVRSTLGKGSTFTLRLRAPGQRH